MVLQVIQALMVKSRDLFLEHFARLGIFNMVHSLAGVEGGAAAELAPEIEKSVSTCDSAQL